MAVLQGLIVPSYLQTCVLSGTDHLRTFLSLNFWAEAALASTQKGSTVDKMLKAATTAYLLINLPILGALKSPSPGPGISPSDVIFLKWFRVHSTSSSLDPR
jgi:hypothetical protein